MNNHDMKFSFRDFTWSLSLFGTAVGAGILFLPIKAGGSGFVVLMILALLAGPMTWLSHKFLARFVLAAKDEDADITDAVKEYWGLNMANVITFAYFFTLFPIVLIYGVGITNTIDSLIVNQFNMASPPRWLLSGVLILLMTGGVAFGKEIMLKASSAMVYPLVFILIGMSLYLIPDWSMAVINEPTDWGAIPVSVWLAIPIIVFSFSHFAIISQFAKEQRRVYGIENAGKKTDAITFTAASMLLVFVLLFVFSVVLSLTPEQLNEAREQNITIVSYLANIHGSIVISLLGPLIAIVAISSSYFGHFLGAHEGLSGLIRSRSGMSSKTISSISLGFIVVTTWIVAIINPSILGLIETIGSPMMAAILFVMPVVAMYTVPSMAKYRGKTISNIFIATMGFATIAAVIYPFL